MAPDVHEAQERFWNEFADGAYGAGVPHSRPHRRRRIVVF